MKLKQNVFEFGTDNKTESLELNRASQIVLIINDIETDILIEKLFIDPELDEDDITGYSVLQLLKEGKLFIDETTSLNISFLDKHTNKKFFVNKIRRPWAYDDDIEITDEQRIAYVTLLLNAIKPLTMLSGEGALPDEGVETALPVSTTPLVLGGDEWDNIRTHFIDLGFSEIVSKNYRFFHKENEIAFYELIPGNYLDIDLFDDGENIYSFKNNEGNEFELTFKNNKLNIKQVVL